ncbi:MAG: serine/threonine protein kinase [Rubrivivax sp.]|nr:serine/threonine protein kinase [Rubrivivax sp.]
MTAAETPRGTVLAGYRIERLLGRGGLGSVHLALDRTGAPVALKLFDLRSDAGDDRHLFEREVGLSRRLRHPGIVAIVDAGQAGGLAFIAMEYVAGGDLAHRSGHGQPMAAARAVSIAARVAQALAHAHAHGVLHRDVKPANILVDEAAGEVKLGDFGLARLADLQRSRTGAFAGTPAYMSPEHLAEGAQDARADLYSLGVVLFELLTGRLPHEAASLGALLRQVASRPAPPLHLLRPDVPPELSDLVARLLARDKTERPADAATLAQALQALGIALADDVPAPAKRAQRPPRPGPGLGR